MLVGLTVPWAGAAIGLVFGLLLSLAFSRFWVPLIAGTSVGVLYLQVRWTTLILTEWKEPKYIPDSTDKRVVEKKPEDVRAPIQPTPVTVFLNHRIQKSVRLNTFRETARNEFPSIYGERI